MAAEKETVWSIVKLNLSRMPWGDFLPCMFAPLVILEISLSFGASFLVLCLHTSTYEERSYSTSRFHNNRQCPPHLPMLVHQCPLPVNKVSS